jgi:hypothetical protein
VLLLISLLLPLVVFAVIVAVVMFSGAWRLWNKVEREIVRAVPAVGPVRHDAMVVAAAFQHAGFIPSVRGWQVIPGFNWNLLNLVRNDGTTAEIVSGTRPPNVALATRFVDGRRLLTTTSAALRVNPSVLRQTFPGADADELLRWHDSSLAALRPTNHVVPVTPADVDDVVIRNELESIAFLRRHRFANVVSTMWRQLTHSHRDLGPVTNRIRAGSSSTERGTTHP